MDTRKLIDYAMDGDAAAFREALYSQIHDRVSAHIEAKKQEIAQNLIAQEEVVYEEEEHDDEKEDKQLVKKMVKKSALKEEDEIFEAGRLIEDFNMINEVSLGAKIRAYAHHATNAWEHGEMGNDDEAEHHEAKAEKIHAHILKHHGPEAAKHAEKAADANTFGTARRNARASAGDSLGGGLRGMHSKAVTKKGIIPKSTQSAMKNRAKGSYGDRIVGPKGHLPEEVELEEEEEKKKIFSGPMKKHEEKWHMKKEEIEQLDEIGDTPEGKAKLKSYQDKAQAQVVKHWADVHDKSYERPDTKMVKRNQGVGSAGRRIHGFGIDNSKANTVTGRFEYRKAVGKSHVYKNLGNKEEK